jgi:tryptophan-rich sensory protein
MRDLDLETTQESTRARSLLALTGFLLACFGVSAVGGLVTASSVGTWYPTLARPPFTPPDWVFAPVWTLLYAMIAVAGWRAWRRKQHARRTRALTLYGIQLALNLAWSCVFFGLQALGAGVVVIALLLAAIVATAIALYGVDRWAGLLFVPYAAWVGFAAVLNASFWLLN